MDLTVPIKINANNIFFSSQDVTLDGFTTSAATHNWKSHSQMSGSLSRTGLNSIKMPIIL